MKKAFGLLFLSLFLSSNECQTQNKCASNEDCVLIKKGCCGCSQGGKQMAIEKSLKSSVLNEYKESCKEVMCPQMISKDESCQKKAACVSGHCELKD